MEFIINAQKELNLEMSRLIAKENNPTSEHLRAINVIMGCSELQFEEVLMAMGKDCRFARMVDADLKLHALKMVGGSVLALPFIVTLISLLLCL